MIVRAWFKFLKAIVPGGQCPNMVGHFFPVFCQQHFYNTWLSVNQNWTMYLSKSLNIFAQIVKYICPNFDIYLVIGSTDQTIWSLSANHFIVIIILLPKSAFRSYIHFNLLSVGQCQFVQRFLQETPSTRVQSLEALFEL